MTKLFLVVVFCSTYGFTKNKTIVPDNAPDHQAPIINKNIEIISYENILTPASCEQKFV